MKYLINYESFLNEGFIHYTPYNKSDCIVDPLVDFKEYVYAEETSENADIITKYLKSKKNCLIKVYHGTHPDIPILEEGLKTTKNKTKHSYQSQVGYTYFSIFPSMAKTFGNIGFGINNAVVYECLIPIKDIKPDDDQLFNARMYKTEEPKSLYGVEMYKGVTIGKTIGDSIIWGHGVRVKGDIPPYMIKVYNFENK